MKAKIIGLVVGVVITPITLFLAVASAGGGHGDYLLARLFYPASMLSTLLTSSISTVAIVGACLQFPIYGWLVGAGWQKARRPLTIIPLGFHAMMLICVFVFLDDFGR